MSVSVTIEGDVGRITLDRPKVRNAITVELNVALREALERFEEEDVRAAVLCGAQGSFCAGADLAIVREAFEGDPPEVLAPLVDSLHATIRKLRSVPFPTVAAVQGFAVGAGMGLALAADLRVVGSSAKLVPGYFGIGASPDGGVSYFLTRALGGARSSSIILRNEALDAETLEASGLAERVVDDDEVVKAATELAGEVSVAPPLALVRMRRLVDAASLQSLDTHLDDERDTVAELWPTHDFQEGVGAFLERRTPEFTGE